jgi:site-specific DNA-cytosine methylase
MFFIDYKTDERLKPTKNSEYETYISPSKSKEFVGRAVPPLMMKAIAEHIYENILKRINP